MKNILLCCLLALVLTPAVQAEDQVFNYPAKKPIFSIAFPEAWKVETGEGSLSASSKDELVNMELVVLDADEAATAIDDAKESLEEELKGIKWDGEPQKGELGGFNATIINGSVSLEGVKMAVNGFVFAPKEGKTFFMLFNIVPFQSLEEHGDEIKKVIDSIKGK